MQNKKAGRPATGKGKPRQLGRVHESDWDEIQQGARLSGAASFTQWAVALLLKAARKQIKKVQDNE